jgi:hypothetical protein
MKYWASIVAGLYLLILIVLTVPAISLAFLPDASAGDAAAAYASWLYWLWLAVMVGCQIALLAVPVRVANRRPVSRRSLWPTLLAGGLMMAGLAAGAIFSLHEFLFRDQEMGSGIGWSTLALAALTWAAWTLVFFRMSRNAPVNDLISRQCRWLFRGSILELLIAIPTHVVARYRDYCCAGFMTFIGLTMGFSVMLFSYGPAVFLLFAERWQRLHPRPPATSGLPDAHLS